MEIIIDIRTASKQRVDTGKWTVLETDLWTEEGAANRRSFPATQCTAPPLLLNPTPLRGTHQWRRAGNPAIIPTSVTSRSGSLPDREMMSSQGVTNRSLPSDSELRRRTRGEEGKEGKGKGERVGGSGREQGPGEREGG